MEMEAEKNAEVNMEQRGVEEGHMNKCEATDKDEGVVVDAAVEEAETGKKKKKKKKKRRKSNRDSGVFAELDELPEPSMAHEGEGSEGKQESQELANFEQHTEQPWQGIGKKKNKKKKTKREAEGNIEEPSATATVIEVDVTENASKIVTSPEKSKKNKKNKRQVNESTEPVQDFVEPTVEREDSEITATIGAKVNTGESEAATASTDLLQSAASVVSDSSPEKKKKKKKKKNKERHSEDGIPIMDISAETNNNMPDLELNVTLEAGKDTDVKVTDDNALCTGSSPDKKKKKKRKGKEIGNGNDIVMADIVTPEVSWNNSNSERVDLKDENIEGGKDNVTQDSQPCNVPSPEKKKKKRKSKGSKIKDTSMVDNSGAEPNASTDSYDGNNVKEASDEIIDASKEEGDIYAEADDKLKEGREVKVLEEDISKDSGGRTTVEAIKIEEPENSLPNNGENANVEAKIIGEDIEKEPESNLLNIQSSVASGEEINSEVEVKDGEENSEIFKVSTNLNAVVENEAEVKVDEELPKTSVNDESDAAEIGGNEVNKIEGTTGNTPDNIEDAIIFKDNVDADVKIIETELKVGAEVVESLAEDTTLGETTQDTTKVLLIQSSTPVISKKRKRNKKNKKIIGVKDEVVPSKNTVNDENSVENIDKSSPEKNIDNSIQANTSDVKPKVGGGGEENSEIFEISTNLDAKVENEAEVKVDKELPSNSVNDESVAAEIGGIEVNKIEGATGNTPDNIEDAIISKDNVDADVKVIETDLKVGAEVVESLAEDTTLGETTQDTTKELLIQSSTPEISKKRKRNKKNKKKNTGVKDGEEKSEIFEVGTNLDAVVEKGAEVKVDEELPVTNESAEIRGIEVNKIESTTGNTPDNIEDAIIFKDNVDADLKVIETELKVATDHSLIPSSTPEISRKKKRNKKKKKKNTGVKHEVVPSKYTVNDENSVENINTEKNKNYPIMGNSLDVKPKVEVDLSLNQSKKKRNRKRKANRMDNSQWVVQNMGKQKPVLKGNGESNEPASKKFKNNQGKSSVKVYSEGQEYWENGGKATFKMDLKFNVPSTGGKCKRKKGKTLKHENKTEPGPPKKKIKVVKSN